MLESAAPSAALSVKTDILEKIPCNSLSPSLSISSTFASPLPSMRHPSIGVGGRRNIECIILSCGHAIWPWPSLCPFIVSSFMNISSSQSQSQSQSQTSLKIDPLKQKAAAVIAPSGAVSPTADDKEGISIAAAAENENENNNDKAIEITKGEAATTTATATDGTIPKKEIASIEGPSELAPAATATATTTVVPDAAAATSAAAAAAVVEEV
eukprot:994580_1